MMPQFEIAVLDSNILSAIGLQQILEDIIPLAEIRVFNSFEEMCSYSERFVHYFVASRIFFEHTDYFKDESRKAIVLVNGDLQICGVKTLNVCQKESAVVKSILALHSHHGKGAHGMQQRSTNNSLLSTREIEVAILLAKGMINKEVADKLNIGITTVITHRKNIMNKLNARSLADIIVYVVMNGLVEIGEL